MTTAKLVGDDDAVPVLMSFTSCVPAGVPSVIQSSVPVSGAVVPSFAENSTELPNRVRFCGAPFKLPTRMSRNRIVPAAVPSVENSSLPTPGTPASISTRPFSTVRLPGLDASEPGLRSTISDVPAAVPSLRHGSKPVVPLLPA